MTPLPLLLELQSLHDGLRTIQRDLSSFPHDMAALDSEVKALDKRIDRASKEATELEAQVARQTRLLAEAQKLEDTARNAVKGATQKIQYTAAIRELDERERQRNTVARPLKEATARLDALRADLAAMTSRRSEAQARFDELHEIFLSEHENQVVGRTRLEQRRTEVEAELDPSLVSRFNRLLQNRQDRAMAAVESGTCTGCRTKLRNPFLNELRERKTLPCEYCQRMLYIPDPA